jgi:hypothetical protein
LDAVAGGAGTGGVGVAHPTMISTIIIAVRRLLVGAPFSFKCRSRVRTFFRRRTKEEPPESLRHSNSRGLERDWQGLIRLPVMIRSRP